MKTTYASEAIQHLHTALLRSYGAGLTDSQLLESFIEHRDEAAFAALVKRHGPMVWGVCTRHLDHHDAEDAFQATFLVLVRKAASIFPREMMPNWLHGVAHRMSLHARRASARRRAREAQSMANLEPEAARRGETRELQSVLDQEISRLPDSYRAVIILCDWENMTRKEAARQLGIPEGTVASRLVRARSLLVRRLARHGVTAASGGLIVGIPRIASARVPSALTSSTIKTATRVAEGQDATKLVSANVAALKEGVIRKMLLTKFKIAATGIAISVGIGAFAAWRLTYPSGAPESRSLETSNSKLVSIASAAATKQNVDLKAPGEQSGPNAYRALFCQTLALLGEYVDSSAYANVYEGRIEGWTFHPVRQRMSVLISPTDDGSFRFSIVVQVNPPSEEGALSDEQRGPPRRDYELERVILQRLNGLLKRPVAPTSETP